MSSRDIVPFASLIGYVWMIFGYSSHSMYATGLCFYGGSNTGTLTPTMKHLGETRGMEPVFSRMGLALGFFRAWTHWGHLQYISYIMLHYCDVIMNPTASLITSLTIVYSTVYSDTDQRKHQSPASLAFVWGTHRGPVNSPHKWPVTRKMFPFDDVIMISHISCYFFVLFYLIFL